MAAWLTVYATAHVDRLDSEFLVDCLHDPILGDIGESWGFDYDGTLELLGRCEVQTLGTAKDETYSILVPDRRPIDVTRLVDGARIDEERAEALETLTAASDAAKRRVEGMLANLKEVVMFELGWPALDREEAVAAWFIALELAESAGGLVRDFEDRWWDPRDRSSAL